MAETRCDWVAIVEPRSRERMYVNLVSGECGWDPPPGVAVRQSDGNQWWELFDSNSNRFYYYNSCSQTTEWHRPLGCDILPLAQLQARRRGSEPGGRVYGQPQRGHTPLPPAPDASGRETPSKGHCDSLENRRNASRELDSRWQPAPGSKAAMLVKVNSIGRNQSAGGTNARPLPPLTQVCYAHSDRPSLPVKMAAVPGASPAHQTLRPASPQYGSTPPIYDEPPQDPPIYDEPPADMEVEGGRLLTRPTTLTTSPTLTLNSPLTLRQPQGHTQDPQSQSQPQAPHPQPQSKLLPYPASLVSKHRRSPSATEYSPAGRECIKHMINVDPVACKQSPHPPLSQTSQTPQAPLCLQGPLPPQPPLSQTSQSTLPPQPASLTEQTPNPVLSPSPPPDPGQTRPREASLEKQSSWRLLEASVRKSMEARHSRQNSLASQDSPALPTVCYQDSGYSTGPSPSLRRKNRRRALGGGGGGVRPGSLGSSGDLNDRLMAEMREVVSRSSTLRGSKVTLDTPALHALDTLPLQALPRGEEGHQGGGGEEVNASNRSLYRAGGNHGDVGGQKRTFEKVDSLEKSNLLPPDTPRPPSQTGTLDSLAQSELSSPLGGGAGQGGGGGGYLHPPPPEVTMVAWARNNLNQHTHGLFRRRVPLATMLSWSPAPIRKPMLAATGSGGVRKEACDMFKLVQAYMGDRPCRLERRSAALVVVSMCWSGPALRDELYIQLLRQTSDNPGLRSLQAGWELMAISLAFFSPSATFRRCLASYLHTHLEESHDKMILQSIMEHQERKNKRSSKSRKKRKQDNEEEGEEGLPISSYAKYCYRKLQKVAVTGGKKGLRKPTLEEVDQGRTAILTPSLFGSTLQEIMERQSQLFPRRRLPWVQVQLSQVVLALGGAQTEGIFRVPGDIDEVNALKLQVDKWNIPENLSDANVPASLLKLWYRELEDPVIPQSFYQRCISNYDDPEAAVNVVHSLPELSRLVLCYFIHFLQVFAQPVNVSRTKMDVNNLAMVMAPNCLRCQSDDPRIIFQNTRKEMSFLRMLIVHLDTSSITGLI